MHLLRVKLIEFGKLPKICRQAEQAGKLGRLSTQYVPENTR